MLNDDRTRSFFTGGKLDQFDAPVETVAYEIRQRTQDGPPILYRFANPKDPNFPAMLELFCRKPEQIT